MKLMVYFFCATSICSAVIKDLSTHDQVLLLSQLTQFTKTPTKAEIRRLEKENFLIAKFHRGNQIEFYKLFNAKNDIKALQNRAKKDNWELVWLYSPKKSADLAQSAPLQPSSSSFSKYDNNNFSDDDNNFSDDNKN